MNNASGSIHLKNSNIGTNFDACLKQNSNIKDCINTQIEISREIIRIMEILRDNITDEEFKQIHICTYSDYLTIRSSYNIIKKLSELNIGMINCGVFLE